MVFLIILAIIIIANQVFTMKTMEEEVNKLNTKIANVENQLGIIAELQMEEINKENGGNFNE